MKIEKITSRITAILLAMLIVPVLIIGCGSKEQISKEVYDGCIKVIDVFEAHKKDNYSELTQKELDEYIEFVNTHKEKGTPKEQEVFKGLGEVMIAYSTDSSEVAKGQKPVLYEEKKKEFMNLLKKYANNK